ncbi:MAG TPA: YhjD/YihY/BrkB family envelope integrity protein [Acidimicrobiales bacterium]|nr:YhjD/YihY/BrkB family envelope integrity protein [Acidimicrobiales bacterium]
MTTTTAASAPPILCVIDLDAPVDTVYGRWTSSERIVTFLGGASRERSNGPAAVDWVELVEGRSSDFSAEVVEQVPGQRIAWQGRGRPHAGSVSFDAIGAGRSRITVELDWRPDGEGGVADRLIVRRQLQDELEGFRSDLASGAPAQPGAATGAHRAGEVTAPRGSDDVPGEGADSPAAIPGPGWIAVIKRTIRQLKTDNVPLIAAGAAFYVFLALVPALIALISVYGLVADPVDVSSQLGPVLAAMPPAAAEVVSSQITSITSKGETGLGLGLVISVLVALYGASKGVLGLVTALNIAYDEDETRGFLRLRGLTLLLTVGLSIAAVVGIGGMVIVGNVAERLGDVGALAVTVLRWPVLAALAAAGLSVMYRYAPDRKAPPWRWVTPGAIVAIALWLLGSIGFSVYVAVFGKFNETYGILGGVVVLLLWLLLTAYAVVLGAELDRELERQRAGATDSGGA